MAVEVVLSGGNLVAFLLAVALIVPVARQLGFAYAMLIPLYLFPPFLAHLVTSMGRFTSVLFPIFFLLAIAVPRSRLLLVAAFFGTLQAILGVLFFLGNAFVG